MKYSVGSLEAASWANQQRLGVAKGRCAAAEQELRDANLELHEARKRARELKECLAEARQAPGVGVEEIIYEALEAELHWEPYSVPAGLLGALADTIADRLRYARKLVQGE